ncbi:MAG: IclR family transcriptional regulator [Thermodesulfobacteriota bacterium]
MRNKAKMKNHTRYFINSLEKGLAVLDIFSKHKAPLSLTDVARLTNMNLVSATRYLRTLTDLGYLAHDPSNKKYSPASKIISLGLSFLSSLDLRDRVSPQLVSVSQEFDVTTSCCILDGIEIVYVERVKGGDIIHLDLGPGSRLPAYITAMGRAILANLPSKALAKIVNKMEFKRHTPYTITDKKELLEELERTRKRGFAQNIQETKLGYSNFAAPIFKGDQVEAALGVTLAFNQTEDERFMKALIERLIDAANKTSILD